MEFLQALNPAVPWQLAEHPPGVRIREHRPKLAVPGEVREEAVPPSRWVVDAAEPVAWITLEYLFDDDCWVR